MLIYRLTHRGSGKVYVGMTTMPLSLRMSAHRSAARKGRPQPISRAIAKYGFDAFDVEVLATAQTVEDLAALEQQLIAAHKATDPRHGYNLSTGGKGGSVGAKRSEDYIARLRARMTGSTLSPDARQRLSDSAKARGAPAHLVEGSRRAWSDPAKRAAMTAQRVGRRWTPEQRVLQLASRGKRGPTAHGRKMAVIMAVDCGPLHRATLVQRGVGKKEVCLHCEERTQERHAARKMDARLNRALWTLGEEMRRLKAAA